MGCSCTSRNNKRDFTSHAARRAGARGRFSRHTRPLQVRQHRRAVLHARRAPGPVRAALLQQPSEFAANPAGPSVHQEPLRAARRHESLSRTLSQRAARGTRPSPRSSQTRHMTTMLTWGAPSLGHVGVKTPRPPAKVCVMARRARETRGGRERRKWLLSYVVTVCAVRRVPDLDSRHAGPATVPGLSAPPSRRCDGRWPGRPPLADV